MKIEFKPHNTHWKNPDRFRELDPHLSTLLDLPLVYNFPLLSNLPRQIPGIYSITGGRQIGKTTLLKQYMEKLLEDGVNPQAIFYISGEMINDHHELVRLAGEYIGKQNSLCFLIIDEITYIKDWDKGVKYLADAGLVKNAVMLLSGSDTVVIRDARMRFPGRRGRADRVDFHLYALTFAEYVSLKKKISISDAKALSEIDRYSEEIVQLETLFRSYLTHGGYLTAINDLEIYNTITRSTFATYCDWIRGDVLKRGKSEHFLREIITAIIRKRGSQLSWNSLSHELSIDHPATVSDYVELLARMDAAIIQLALREDKLTGAPKKARKLHFSDPFILHALESWIYDSENPYEELTLKTLKNPETLGHLVESCAVSHFSRFYPTYYIKNKGEVDIAYIRNDKFWPIEVKWTSQLRPNELKQVSKYSNSIICAKADMPSEINGITCRPLVTELLRLGPSPLYLIH